MNYDGNFDLGFDGEWIGLFQFALGAQYLLQRAAVQRYPRTTFAQHPIIFGSCTIFIATCSVVIFSSNFFSEDKT